MPRATNNPASRRRRKKIFKQAKGNFGGRSNSAHCQRDGTEGSDLRLS